MQAIRPTGVRSEINVTPLVDVVLVLLIIFMIVTPKMLAGPAVTVPTTDHPPQRPDDGVQIVVGLERGGTIWIESDRVSAEQFQQRMSTMAETHAGWPVLIKGDAGLSFGEVRRAMLAVESAGFAQVGLIAEQLERR